VFVGLPKAGAVVLTSKMCNPRHTKDREKERKTDREGKKERQIDREREKQDKGSTK